MGAIMSNFLSDAFNLALSITQINATWIRPGVVDEIDIKVSVSNYSRNKLGPEEISMSGREFVVPMSQIEGKALFPLKKGDTLAITGYGDNHIDEVTIMNGLNGEILGFRIRTS